MLKWPLESSIGRSQIDWGGGEVWSALVANMFFEAALAVAKDNDILIAPNARSPGASKTLPGLLAENIQGRAAGKGCAREDGLRQPEVDWQP